MKISTLLTHYAVLFLLASCNPLAEKKEDKKTLKDSNKDWYYDSKEWVGVDSLHQLTLEVSQKRGATIKNNPIINYMGSADPSTQVVGNKLYVYPSHDAFEEEFGIGYAMFDYHVYSTDNLLDFKDNGVALRGIDIEWKGYQGASHCYDPSAITVGDSTYFYFFLARNANKNKSATMGVATGSSPAGPFKDALGEPLVNHSDMPDHQAGSPQAFIDYDGNPWLLWGAHARTGMRRLKKNMIEFEEGSEYIELTEYTPGFKEAPWMYKYNGKYYLTFTAREDGHELGILYSVADSPEGPYKYKGKIMHPHNIRTHHHSIVNFHDQWYIFYHIDFNGNEYYRQACAEYLFHNEDGTIAPVRHTYGGVGRKNAFMAIEGEKFFTKNGAELKDHPLRQIKKVVQLSNNTSATYNGIVFHKEATTMNFILLDGSSGTIKAYLDNKTILEQEINGQETIAIPVDVKKGEYELKIEWTSENSNLRVDKFYFE